MIWRIACSKANDTNHEDCAKEFFNSDPIGKGFIIRQALVVLSGLLRTELHINSKPYQELLRQAELPLENRPANVDWSKVKYPLVHAAAGTLENRAFQQIEILLTGNCMWQNLMPARCMTYADSRTRNWYDFSFDNKHRLRPPNINYFW